MKNSLKTAKSAAGIIIYTSAILGIAAQLRKNVVTHAKHEDHSPCDCDKQCLGCLFEG